jgi:hypothetical protein
MTTANSDGTTDITNIESNLKQVIPKAQTPIFVPFTSLNRTLKAREKASQIAQTSDGRIELLVLQSIPYPLQLNHPQVPNEFLLKQLAKIAEQF